MKNKKTSFVFLNVKTQSVKKVKQLHFLIIKIT